MSAEFVQEGITIDHIPATDLPLGTVVVQEDLVGIANRPIRANQLGSLTLAGVFRMPKRTGSGQAIATGKKVYWHVANEEVRDTATGGKALGKTVADAGDDDPTVLVRLGDAG